MTIICEIYAKSMSIEIRTIFCCFRMENLNLPKEIIETINTFKPRDRDMSTPTGKIMKRYNYAKWKHDKKCYTWNCCPGKWTYFEEPATPEDKQILREIALRHNAREEERNRLNTNAQEL